MREKGDRIHMRGAAGAAVAGAAAAAAAEAQRALVGGLLVEVDAPTFQRLAYERRDKLVVMGEIGTLKKQTLYAFSEGGLVICCKIGKGDVLSIPNPIIRARKMVVPAI